MHPEAETVTSSSSRSVPTDGRPRSFPACDSCGNVTPRHLQKRFRKAKLKRNATVKRRIMRKAKFNIGDVVRHRVYPFRGVIFDVDAEFSNTEEWWLSIPEEIRPRKDQPFYHLLAENAEEGEYIAYVSEQNLVPDTSGEPVHHSQVEDFFTAFDPERNAYEMPAEAIN